MKATGECQIGFTARCSGVSGTKFSFGETEEGHLSFQVYMVANPVPRHKARADPDPVIN